MSKFSEYIGSQFGNPRGFVGKVCCVIMNVINNKMYKNVVSLINVGSNEKVLDIGYGNGHLQQLLYKKCQPEMYGIDISEDMKEKATSANKKAALAGKLHLEVGDVCALAYKDCDFSSVSSINTVYFWNDTVKGLSEIYRVLKDGAAFYNVVYTKQWLDKLSYTKKSFKKFEPEELMEVGRQAGFEKMEVKDIVKGKSFVVIYTK